MLNLNPEILHYGRTLDRSGKKSLSLLNDREYYLPMRMIHNLDILRDLVHSLQISNSEKALTVSHYSSFIVSK